MTWSDEQIERAAKVIYNAHPSHTSDYNMIPWEMFVNKSRTEFIARAVADALVGPDQVVVERADVMAARNRLDDITVNHRAGSDLDHLDGLIDALDAAGETP